MAIQGTLSNRLRPGMRLRATYKAIEYSAEVVEAQVRFRHGRVRLHHPRGIIMTGPQPPVTSGAQRSSDTPDRTRTLEPRINQPRAVQARPKITQYLQQDPSTPVTLDVARKQLLDLCAWTDQMEKALRAQSAKSAASKGLTQGVMQ